MIPCILINYILYTVTHEQIKHRESGQGGGWKSSRALYLQNSKKESYDAIIQLGKQADELFKRQGALRLEIFQLNNGKTYEDMGFVNIVKTVSAAPDEGVWVELQSYRDRNNLDEISGKMKSDERAGQLGLQFMDLIVPGSCIVADFNRV